MNRFLLIILSLLIANEITWASVSENEGILPIKEYTLSDCEKYGLKPVDFGNGQLLMPKNDGVNYFVDINSNYTPQKVTAEDVRNTIDKLRKAGKVVNDILNVHLVSDLPVVIQKEMNGVFYEILLNALVFTPTGNSISMNAMISTSDNYFAFEGQNIRFTGQGGIESGSLNLILDNNPGISNVQLGTKINLKITGGGFSFGCNGFEDFSIIGKVLFDRSLIVPENTNGDIITGNVQSDFRIEHVRDFNDLIIDISMQPFQLPNMVGYGFQVKNAIIDLSSQANASNFLLPAEYTSAVDGPLWKGVSIGNIEVRFPKEYKNRTTKNRIIIGANNLLIDKNGLSGEIYGKNIMQIKDGDLNGWDYSLDDARIVLVKNQVKSGTLEGQIRLSISNENRLLGYNAIIDPTRNYYNFTVSTDKNLEFEFLKASQVTLKPSSSVSLTLDNGEFVASAMLHGQLDITASQVSLERYDFERLFISTRAPYLSIGYFGGGSEKEYKLGGFPISIQSPIIGVSNNEVSVGFGVKVNLDNIGIEATGGFTIQGVFVNENNRHFWRNKRFALNKLSVSADLAVGHFAGEIDFFQDDPIYGNGFGGAVKLSLNTPSEMEIAAMAVFGKTQDRYWMVDGELSSGGGIAGLSINLLAGSLYKHMKAVPNARGPRTITGAVYEPDFSIGWGGRFGIGFQASTAFGGMAAFEIETRADGSLRQIGFIGTAAIAGSDAMVNQSAVREKYYLLCNDSALSAVGGVTSQLENDPNGTDTRAVSEKFSIPTNLTGFTVSVIMKINFDDHSFYGKVGANVSVANTIQLQGVGAFLFAPNIWFVHIGEPPLSDRIIVLLPSLPQIDGYIMLGHGIPELPNPEPNVFTKYPNAGQRNRLNGDAAILGKGIAFGAGLQVAAVGDYKIIRWDVGARIGLDVMLMRYPDGAYCEGRFGEGIGIKNWRAAAQVYILGWFHAAAFGANVLSVELGAMLRGAAPNPTYGQGEVAVKFKVLFTSFNFDVGFQVGDDCVVVGGSDHTTEENLINTFYPSNLQEVNPDVIPSVSCSYDLERETVLPDISGRFRIKVMDYTMNSMYGPISGNMSFNEAEPTKVSFIPNPPLPAFTPITQYVRFQVQQFENGDWKPFMYEGKVLEASKSSAFIVVKTREEMKQDVDNSVQVAEKEADKIVVKEEEKAEEIKQEAVKTIDNVVAVADSAADALKDGCEKCTEAGKDSVTTIIKDLKEDIKDEAQEAKNKIDQIVTKALADVNARIEQAKADVNTNANSTKSLIDNDANVCEREILAKKQVLAMGINQLCNSNYTSNYNPYNNGRDNNYSNYKTLNLDNRSYYVDCSNSDSEIKKILKESADEINRNYFQISAARSAEAIKQNKAIMDKAQQDCDAIMAAAAGATQEVINQLRARCIELIQKALSECEKVDGYENKTDMSALIQQLTGISSPALATTLPPTTGSGDSGNTNTTPPTIDRPTTGTSTGSTTFVDESDNAGSIIGGGTSGTISTPYTSPTPIVPVDYSSDINDNLPSGIPNNDLYAQQLYWQQQQDEQAARLQQIAEENQRRLEQEEIQRQQQEAIRLAEQQRLEELSRQQEYEREQEVRRQQQEQQRLFELQQQELENQRVAVERQKAEQEAIQQEELRQIEQNNIRIAKQKQMEEEAQLAETTRLAQLQAEQLRLQQLQAQQAAQLAAQQAAYEKEQAILRRREMSDDVYQPVRRIFEIAEEY